MGIEIFRARRGIWKSHERTLENFFDVCVAREQELFLSVSDLSSD
jgi:hypothetical protein